MKKIITILSLVSISFISKAQVVGTSTVPPKTASAEEGLALKEAEYDFGKIPQGKPVTHVFEVMNSGADSITITNVQASCGCTTPVWEKNKLLLPGEATKINVGYNAAAEGPFSRNVTITYNQTHQKVLVIKGEVWKAPASSAPENKDLKSLKEE